jgi:anthranilate synthase component 1
MRNMDVLRATFPAGTLTGAPKVHAMELIDQLEPTKRGIYGGACGYLQLCRRHGCGHRHPHRHRARTKPCMCRPPPAVVADSVPEMEWAETERKARALLRAAELVEQGLE